MARIPQFGDWDNTNNGPFTMCFDQARKEKVEGKQFNPNGTRKAEVQRHKPANNVASALLSQEKMKQPQEGRPRPKPVDRGNRTGGQALPKFGEWDDPSMAAAGGYTVIFDDMRPQKNDDTKNVPLITVKDGSNHGGNKDDQIASDDDQNSEGNGQD